MFLFSHNDIISSLINARNLFSNLINLNYILHIEEIMLVVKITHFSLKFRSMSKNYLSILYIFTKAFSYSRFRSKDTLWICLSFTRSLAHLVTHSFRPSLTESPTHSDPYLLSRPLIQTLTHLITHSFKPSLTQSRV